MLIRTKDGNCNVQPSVFLSLDSDVCLQLSDADFILFQPGSVLIAKRGGVDQDSVESPSGKKKKKAFTNESD